MKTLKRVVRKIILKPIEYIHEKIPEPVRDATGTTWMVLFALCGIVAGTTRDGTFAKGASILLLMVLMACCVFYMLLLVIAEWAYNDGDSGID